MRGASRRSRCRPRRPARFDAPGSPGATAYGIIAASSGGLPVPNPPCKTGPAPDTSPMAQYVYTMNRVGKIVPPKRQILKDISLSFFPGAKIGVLGLNGSGKSTLLKIMAGIDHDIEGEAVPMPNLKIGYLPQEPQLDP